MKHHKLQTIDSLNRFKFRDYITDVVLLSDAKKFTRDNEKAKKSTSSSVILTNNYKDRDNGNKDISTGDSKEDNRNVEFEVGDIPERLNELVFTKEFKSQFNIETVPMLIKKIRFESNTNVEIPI